LNDISWGSPSLCSIVMFIYTLSPLHHHAVISIVVAGALPLVRYLAGGSLTIFYCYIYLYPPAHTHAVIPIVVAGALPLVRYLAGGSLPVVSSWNRTPEVCSVAFFFLFFFAVLLLLLGGSSFFVAVSLRGLGFRV